MIDPNACKLLKDFPPELCPSLEKQIVDGLLLWLGVVAFFCILSLANREPKR